MCSIFSRIETNFFLRSLSSAVSSSTILALRSSKSSAIVRCWLCIHRCFKNIRLNLFLFPTTQKLSPVSCYGRASSLTRSLPPRRNNLIITPDYSVSFPRIFVRFYLHMQSLTTHSRFTLKSSIAIQFKSSCLRCLELLVAVKRKLTFLVVRLDREQQKTAINKRVERRNFRRESVAILTKVSLIEV